MLSFSEYILNEIDFLEKDVEWKSKILPDKRFKIKIQNPDSECCIFSFFDFKILKRGKAYEKKIWVRSIKFVYKKNVWSESKYSKKR